MFNKHTFAHTGVVLSQLALTCLFAALVFKSADASAADYSLSVPASPHQGASAGSPKINLIDGDHSIVLGRYTTATSNVLDPLDTLATLNYPRQTVHTIGDALNFTLLRSGYHFNDAGFTVAVKQFLDLPLPESQRKIGPYPIRTILDELCGSAWKITIDSQNRTVSIAPGTQNQGVTASSDSAEHIDQTHSGTPDAGSSASGSNNQNGTSQ